MILLGRKHIILNRYWYTQKGDLRNSRLFMWIDIIDYARCGIWEYIATPHVVLKRVYDGRDSQKGWDECPELCVFNRGHGHTELFDQTITVIAEEI